MRSFSLTLIAGLALACFAFSGCEAAKETAKDGTGSHGHDHDDEGHNHDDGHDHAHAEDAHAHGPNGGHLFTFSGDEFKGEWKHYSDNHVVRVFVLDAAGQKAVPVAAENITIRRTTGDDGTVFTLDPESPDAEGNAAVFSLDSQDLDIAMNLGATIEMKSGDKTYTSNIPPHKPH